MGPQGPQGPKVDVGRVDRKIDAEWEVRRRALGANWTPTEVSGILVTKRKASIWFCLRACLFRGGGLRWWCGTPSCALLYQELYRTVQVEVQGEMRVWTSTLAWTKLHELM